MRSPPLPVDERIPPPDKLLMVRVSVIVIFGGIRLFIS